MLRDAVKKVIFFNGRAIHEKDEFFSTLFLDGQSFYCHKSRGRG